MAKYSMDKKELRHDTVRESMWSLVDLATRYRRWVISGAVGLVACVALIFAYYGYAQKVAAEQAERFYLAEKAMNDTKLPNEKRKAAATAELKAYLEAYPDSRLSPFAWMFLAQIYWDDKNYAEASKAFGEVLNHGQAADFTRHLALIGKAKLEESEGRLADSEARYRSLPDAKFADLKAYNLGRIAAASNRNEEAKTHFQSVISHYPPSRLAKWANDAISVLP